MGFVTENQGTPINGVSQQPQKNRLLGQCTASDNFRPDVVNGLMSRQGTDNSGQLVGASALLSTFWHNYTRDEEEEYNISVEIDGSIKVWSPDGTVHIVNVVGAVASYLASSAPKTSIKAKTIGDYTFLANKDVTVLPSASLTPAVQSSAIFYNQYMDFGQTITVSITHGDATFVGTYTAPDGSLAAHTELVTPSYVTEQIYDSLVADLATAQFTLTLDDNTILIEKITVPPDFNITVTDDADGANAVGIKGKIKDTTLLPGIAPDGFLVEVDPPGSVLGNNDNYWLIADNTTSDHIVWQESREPSISLGLNKSTMPVVLVRESVALGVATFTLREGEWEDRNTGGETTNPQPPFVNNKIQSIGLFQNRLLFTSGEAVVLGSADNFFNFYRDSVQLSLDIYPISVYADTPKVNFLRANEPADKDLVFFSDNGQFILSGSKAITAETAVLIPATSFESDLSVDPVASGEGVFFTFNYGQFTGVREFYTDSIIDTKRARPVTDHVKRYISGSPEIMATSTNLNMLAIKTSNDDNILYIYDWLWRGTDRVQSAWGRYIFGENDKILHFNFKDDSLNIIIVRADSLTYSETINIGSPDDDGLTYSVRADRKVDKVMIQDGEEFKVLDPFSELSIDDILCVRADGAYSSEVGTSIDIYRRDSDGYLYTLEELSSGSDVDVIIGERYNCRYTPTNPVAHDEKGEALNLDKLIIGSFYLNYNQSGEITATIINASGSSRTVKLNNRTLGSPENIIGFATITEGQHKVTIRQRADKYILTYETDSHLPLIIRDLEFNGNLNRRGRRIS